MSEFTFVAELPKPSPRPRPAASWGREKSAMLRRFADALRARPGEWAIWPTSLTPKSAGQVRVRICRDIFPALPADEFEGRSVNGVAYVRYIGGSMQ
ncbi:hypothetical protein [Nocardia vaccinii]|uniref:hypothetical protein n=1 Tax=Nocardia vaccinii TaxID=1822 RepID=UPI000836A508|nr:hypothetical protein [Nocardia vaccinii]